MYRRIVVPLDGSELGQRVLPTAVGLARRSNAELHLVHCVDYISLTPEQSDGEWLHGTAGLDAETYLRDIAFGIVTRTQIRITTRVLDGEATNAILEEAKHVAADLIVMSTHGKGLADRAWLGSVADGVLRQSSIPVLLLRAHEGQARGEEPFRHVLVAIDGSTLSERILKPAAKLARANEAQVTLLEVVHPWVRTTRPMAHAQHAGELRERAVARRTEEAEDYLSELAKAVDPRQKQIQAEVVVAAVSDSAEILQYAAEHAVDVIALATHGRSGVKRLVLGSVADKVIRGANVPVLVMCPGE